jgi:hypothetical protein
MNNEIKSDFYYKELVEKIKNEKLEINIEKEINENALIFLKLKYFSLIEKEIDLKKEYYHKYNIEKFIKIIGYDYVDNDLYLKLSDGSYIQYLIFINNYDEAINPNIFFKSILKSDFFMEKRNFIVNADPTMSDDEILNKFKSEFENEFIK